MLFARFSLLLAPLTLIAGCSTSSASPTAPIDSGPGDALVSCENDARVDQYVANLAKTSPDGQLKVTLVSMDPAPPAVGTSTGTIKLTDGSGAPISNAPITLALYMPDHGHSPSVKPTITPQADGMYAVTNISLFMTGVFRLTFALPATDAGPGPSVQFFFCVPG